MTKTKQHQAILVASGGVATIGLIAFIISYNALQQVAQAHGVGGWLAYLWPLLIDLPILVFAFTSLVIQFITNRQSRFATAMIIVYSFATIMFNLIHSEMNIVNYLVAIVAPLSVIVTIEALRELVQIVALQQPESQVKANGVATVALSQETDVALSQVKANGVATVAPSQDTDVALSQVKANGVATVALSQGTETEPLSIVSGDGVEWKLLSNEQKFEKVKEYRAKYDKITAAQMLGVTAKTIERYSNVPVETNGKGIAN